MTDAAILLTIVRSVKHQHTGLVAVEGPESMEFASRFALGLRLRSKPALALGALMEGWTAEQIVRELF